MLILTVITTVTTAAIAAILKSRNVKVVVPEIVFTQDTTFTTPSHLYRRMEADRQAHVEDFNRRLHQS
jgi:hypothetical protein